MTRTVEVNGDTYIHENDVVDHVLDEGLLDTDTLVDTIMDRDDDAFAFTSWNAMMAFLLDDHDQWRRKLLKEIAERGLSVDAAAAPAKHVIAEIGKFKVKVTAMPGELQIEHVDDLGNKIGKIDENGIKLFARYKGLPGTTEDKLGDNYLRVRYDSSPPPGITVDESKLRDEHATAMWSEDGVVISSRNSGVMQGKTLAAALTGESE